jgi:hypothetical protein
MPDDPQPDLSDAIAENAAGPKRAKGDQGEMEQHSLKDQVEADRYLRNREAAKAGPRALRFSRIVPPGSA